LADSEKDSTMCDDNERSQEPTKGKCVIIRIIGGSLCGAILALIFYWITTWQAFAALWMRFRSEDWQVTEIEIETLGQKWKLANSGSQRRVAWSVFVEIVTRIATQPMLDWEGDDGIVLKSLYDLFQYTRNSITEIEPTRVLPSRTEHCDTVETYALAMLNQDLRPFLSKWHPAWDTWRKENPDSDSSSWEHHARFRADLKVLQPKIRERAKGLGVVAGVSELGRFMNVSPNPKDGDRD
jgi:hypothetical protein